MQQRIRLTRVTLCLGGILLGSAAFGQAIAQRVKQPSVPPKAVADCGCDEPLPAGPQVWAIVDGVKFFDTELKTALAPKIDPLLDQLKSLRRQGLETLINNRLFDKEARARKLSRADYLSKEIDASLRPVTEAEVKSWIDKNRSRITQDTSSESFKKNVVLFLKQQRRNEAIKSLGQALRKKSSVTVLPGADLPNADPTMVLAVVNQEPIQRSVLNEFIKAPSYQIKKRIYNIRKQALELKINTFLLEKEAQRRRITKQRLLSLEVLDKAPMVTREQADAFYEKNRARFKQSEEVLRPQLMSYLRQQAIAKEEARLSAELFKKVHVTMSLPGIVTPVYSIKVAGKPSKGAAKAPITIVEFTDYQCPRCGEVQPTVEKLLATYPHQVRLVVREFPLSQHAHARKAAQAAQCAFEQGKYWEFTELLFKNQQALDQASLMRYAAQVGMDKTLLATHLKSGFHDGTVREDLEEGRTVGVNGTPTFYVNGKRLEDRSWSGFTKAIKRAASSP